MIRYLFGLVALVVMYLGWQWYSGDPSQASGSMLKTADGVAETAGGVAETADQEKLPPVAVRPQTPQPRPGLEPSNVPGDSSAPRDEAEELATDEFLTGDPKTLQEGFQRLRRSSGAAGERLGVELASAVARIDSVEGLLAVLGPGNAFLHSKVGRKAARQAVAKIQQLEPESAVEKMSALLERCMQGSICKTDVAAGQLVDEIYHQHKVLVDRVVFSPANLRKARSHPVRPGETLGGIARRYRKQGINVEGWTLCYVNRISRPNRLRAGVTIKIPIEPVWAKVEKSSFLLAVYVGSTIVRLYWVAHGADDKTPMTSFTVGAKLVDPDWYAPDGNVYAFGHPKNLLGRHFVKFEHKSYQGFGAHGTSEPESIRSMSSQGCLRMYDADIEWFSRFVPRGAKVTIAATSH